MIIHIGYPNCGSTTFQQMLAQSSARFVGCNTKNAPGEFYAPEIGTFFEGPFRFGSNAQFSRDKDRIRAYLAKQDNPVLSYENISFRTTPWDLPTDIKLQRLARLVPDEEEATIVVIYRPLKNLLLALYKSYLGWGYTGNIDKFLAELETLADYGLLADLDLQTLCHTISGTFEGAPILLANLDAQDMFPRLFERLGLAMPSTDMPRYNEGIKDGHIPNMLTFNSKQQPRKNLLDWLELHRLWPNSETLSEDDIFHLSRHRKKLQDYLKNKTPQTFDRAAINWPQEITKLAGKNQNFLTTLDTKSITHLS